MIWKHTKQASTLWHQWFAWHPVRTPVYTVWLARVWRREVGHRGCSGDITWEYSFVDPRDGAGRRHT